MSSPVSTPDTFWSSLREQLLEVIPADTFRVWFDNMRVGHLDEDGCELITPNEFSAIWIRDNYLDVIRQEADRLVGHPFTVELLGDIGEGNHELDINNRSKSKATKTSSSRLTGPALKGRSLGIYPKNTFSNFIVGGGSELAHAACVAVSNAPAHAYNPLFIYGETGLGKTHLMHAVGNEILKQDPNKKIAYVHSEKFVSDMVKSLQLGAINEFKQHYRSLDALLIDDIQFFAKKEQSQEELFHTFNSLLEKGSQMILTCDKYPKEIDGLEDRLKSRLGWGLPVVIEPPELETRVAILLSKAMTMDHELSEESAFFIAQKVRSNVRELEGALKRVIANSNFTGRPITIDLIKDSLKDLLAIQARQVSVELSLIHI